MGGKKRIAILAVTLLLLLAGAGAACVWLWPSLLTGIPLLDMKKTSTSAHEEPASTEKTTQAEHQLKDEHSSKDAPVGAEKAAELVPAADFKMPKTRDSPVLLGMRRISAAQTALARGDAEAGPQLKQAMLDFSENLATHVNGNFTSQEAEAIALYVLSGGNPLEVSKLLEKLHLAEQQNNLMQAVLHYAQGETEKANAAFKTVHPGTSDPLLSAQLNLVLAQMPEAGETSIAKLSRAANLAPGTLIEEAAIRRLIVHLGGKQDVAELLYWAGRYLRRFPKSLYRPDFTSGFAEAAKISAMAWTKVKAESFTRFFDSLGEQERLTIGQTLLRQALDRGDTKTCLNIKASLALKSQPLDVMFELCDIGTMTADSLAALKQVGPASLSEDMAAIHAKAVALAENMLRAEPMLDPHFMAPAQPLVADIDFGGLATSATQQLDASLKLIKEADGHESADDPKP
jgi:chemotaxis protein MotC